MKKLIIPSNYQNLLSREATEAAIKFIKDEFQNILAKKLGLSRVTAPMLVVGGTGINDDLNGVEKPVSFPVFSLAGSKVEVVQSLAKWKRMKLAQLNIENGETVPGIYADMNALRPDEELGNLHSVYVDQWDWERIVTAKQRNLDTLRKTVRKIYEAIRETEEDVNKEITGLKSYLPENIQFIHAEELLDRYPDKSPVERENLIAKEYGAKVYDFEWKDDFAAARNESIKRCSGEWILYMDADERLTEESAKVIRDTVANAPDERGGFICTIESEHKQLTGGTEIHRGGYPRLFRNLGYPKIEFRGRVHEQITPSIVQQGKNFVFSEIVIEHLGYNQSREVMERKIKRNYNMLIRHVKEEPLNAYAWYQLGQTLGQMKLFNEAEQTIKFAIQIGDLSDSVYASAAASLSQMTGNRKQFSEALQWAEKSLDKAPDQIYALNLKAYSLLYLERYEEAERDFREVLNRKKKKRGVPTTGFDVEIPDDVILKGLNDARQKLGRS